MSTQPNPDSAPNDYPGIPPAQADQSQPSPEIDRAICALITHVTNYTDADFDMESMSTTEAEIELLVIYLMRSLLETTIGKRLSAYLLSIREGQGEFWEQTPHPEKGFIESDFEEVIAQFQIHSSGEFLFPDVF